MIYWYLIWVKNDKNTVKGRGAQINTKNKFLQDEYGRFEESGLDVFGGIEGKTEVFEENPKKIVNKVTSPDLGFEYSLNPYQGCEHGCVYCYARNTHEYWGYSAGMDFERKIIVKKNAAETLSKQLMNKNWKVSPIMLSGNTDCYQPLERKLKLTRSVLEVLLKFKHPVGIITKNDLVTRDIDLLKGLAELNLINVCISINSLDEGVRRKLEPRTCTYSSRLKAMELLSKNNIPVHAMVAPVIPGLTSSEIPDVLKSSSSAGARSVSYSIVRLNGAVGEIFIDWVKKQFPDRSDKILHQIADCHGGKLNDSRFGTRMKGEGNVAASINALFKVAKNRYFRDSQIQKLNCEIFNNDVSGQLTLF